jgi:hypothetical protein
MSGISVYSLLRATRSPQSSRGLLPPRHFSVNVIYSLGLRILLPFTVSLQHLTSAATFIMGLRFATGLFPTSWDLKTQIGDLTGKVVIVTVAKYFPPRHPLD